MTTRIGQPDTQADLQLRECLDANQPKSFVMISGAGSGKTTSLVKALDYIGKTRGENLKRKNQKIACITYTEIAEKEIWADVGEAPLFHVSTIHSFLWTIIRPFQEDIRNWVSDRLSEKILEAEEKIAKPRTKPATIEKARLEIERFKAQQENLKDTARFTYGTGSNYEKGILGHDDILRMVPALILARPLLKTLVAACFPFIFVDESQDTTPSVVEALKAIDIHSPNNFCLGFFGDPMQKIYSNGIGKIQEEENWIHIEKPENFRSSSSVLSVINNVRAAGDNLVQTPGFGDKTAPGSARLFIVPADEFRTQRLEEIRNWLATEDNDPLWGAGDDGINVRVLVIVHRMAALRLGFADLYAALNDNQPPSSLKDGFLDGTSWALTPFLSYILPLATAAQSDHQFELISFLRKNCPLLVKEKLTNSDTVRILESLRQDTNRLIELLDSGANFSIAEVLRFVRDKELITLEERLNEYLLAFDNGTLNAATENDTGGIFLSGAEAMTAFFNCPAKQMWAYQKYIEDESPFSTQQGIKGAEFTRVLTVLDDEEGSYPLFSYNKYFGISPLSETDEKNIAEGIESVIDRTRRLFYVSCSRAIQDLGVIFFASDIALAHKKIIESNFFLPENIHILADQVR